MQFCCVLFAASAELTGSSFILKNGANGTSAPDTSVPVSVHLYQVLVYHKEARTVDKVPRDRFSPARVSVSGRNDPTGAAAHAGKDALHRQLHWAQGRTPLNVPRGIISPPVTPCAPVGNDPVALGAHVVGSLAPAKPAQENRTPVRLGMKVKHLPA